MAVWERGWGQLPDEVWLGTHEERRGDGGNAPEPVPGGSSGPSPGGNGRTQQHLGRERLFQLLCVLREVTSAAEQGARETEGVGVSFGSVRKVVQGLAVTRLCWGFESHSYTESVWRGSVAPGHSPLLGSSGTALSSGHRMATVAPDLASSSHKVWRP